MGVNVEKEAKCCSDQHKEASRKISCKITIVGLIVLQSLWRLKREENISKF